MKRMLFGLVLSVVVGGCAASTTENGDGMVAGHDDALTSFAAPVKLADVAGTTWGPLRAGPQHVYFFDERAGAVVRVAKTGGRIEVVLAAANARVNDFAIDTTHVYAVVDRDGDAPEFGAIVRAPLSGSGVGAASETILGGDLSSARIALDANDVYIGTRGVVARFPKTGGAVEAETLDTPRDLSAIAVDATHVYWADMGPGNPAIGCNRGDGAIYGRPKHGGPTRVIAAHRDCPLSLTSDGGMLYFRSFFGQLESVSKMGGHAATISPLTLTEPALDRLSVFFAIPTTGGAVLSSERKVSSMSTTFAGTRGASISAVAVDDVYAYYVTVDSQKNRGELLRILK